MTTWAAATPGTFGGSRAFLTATLTGLIAWLVFALWTPTGGAESSICLLRRTLLPCPGCGMTRAAAHLAKGDWAAAWSAHPLAILLAVEAVAVWFAWGTSLLHSAGNRLGRTGFPRRLWTAWGIGHGLLFLAVWVYRLSTDRLPW